ncbi:hypothetical protein L21TH_0100 [Caldisalinibacter kiritimatiensis]|uniref:Uncharacterized protein n=1 Tax=Caldisalinibacter kiritimatiensis TaxID=1304284 RepID=R1AX93_9FIRM|nr:hypothetical protein L21TH_0100 [Caldisalinibacter kiritimatiensis]
MLGKLIYFHFGQGFILTIWDVKGADGGYIVPVDEFHLNYMGCKVI